MHRLDLTLPTLSANLALDEALLLEAEAGGGECLRFWEWPRPAVVLGAAGVLADDVNESACADGGVEIGRRSSGGGTVLLGPGCLMFALVLDSERSPEYRQIGASYRAILGRIALALAAVQPGIELAGISDLAVAGRKFSGNAQQRKRRAILHHGTLLCGFDLPTVARYLALPPRRPEYRGDRPHADFLRNLPVSAATARALLATTWTALGERDEWPRVATERLVAEKFGRSDWVRRR